MRNSNYQKYVQYYTILIRNIRLAFVSPYTLLHIYILYGCGCVWVCMIDYTILLWEKHIYRLRVSDYERWHIILIWKRMRVIFKLFLSKWVSATIICVLLLINCINFQLGVRRDSGEKRMWQMRSIRLLSADILYLFVVYNTFMWFVERKLTIIVIIY